ncbi:MAG: Fe2+-dependent dioxygenase, partial [Pseudomonadota bacterium]
MITQIHNLLTPEKITVVQSVLAHCDFVDGKASAGDVAAQAKHNEEASLASDRFDALNDIVMSTLVVHPDYLHAAMPARLAAPLYVRYSKGMHYGEHIDDPLMGVQPRYRT